ncbi:MAG: FadR/GntR family transcriptional regulator [Verrucomicrobiota bacterium]
MIGKVSTAEAVFIHLKKLIVGGELKPGDALPSERELQATLGVSRISLREGLARMSALGLISVAHGKGAVVSKDINIGSVADALLPLGFLKEGEHLEELYAARIMIESELAALAAVCRTEEQLQALDENMEQMGDRLGDEESFVELDLEFHRIIEDAAGNRFLSLMHRAIEGPVASLVTMHGASRESREKALERHARIMSAIKAKDASMARELARKHLLESKG